MDYSFPYSIAVLTSGAGVPANGTPIHARDFNRLFSEVAALESAIGPNPQGNKTDFKTRLAVALNDDGTYKKELICEDDPSGNSRGTTRYLYANLQSTTFEVDALSSVAGEGFFKLPYTPFSDPPIFIFCISGAGARIDVERMQIKSISEIGVVIDARKHGGSGNVAPFTDDMHGFAISNELNVWEDDVAWGLPPVRTGS